MATVGLKTVGSPKLALDVRATSVLDPISNGYMEVAVKASLVLNTDIRQITGNSSSSKNSLRSPSATAVATEVTGDVLGSTAVGTVLSIPAGGVSAGFAKGDRVLMIGSGLWSDTIAASTVTTVKLPTTNSSTSSFPLKEAEEAALLPVFAAAYGILHRNTLRAKGLGLQKGDTFINMTSNALFSSAVSQVAQHMGFVAVSVSDVASLKSSPAAAAAADTKVKLVITDQVGAVSKALLKKLAPAGALVVHDTLCNISTSDCSTTTTTSSSSRSSTRSSSSSSGDVGLSVPVSAALFEEKIVSGFSLSAWSAHNTQDYKHAVAFVAGLAAEGKLSLNCTGTGTVTANKIKAYSHQDAVQAVEEASRGEMSVVLTF